MATDDQQPDQHHPVALVGPEVQGTSVEPGIQMETIRRLNTSSSCQCGEKPRSRWSCCIWATVCPSALVALVLLLREVSRRAEFQRAKARMDQDIAKVEQGKTTSFINPDPRFLEDLVTKHTACAAKLTMLEIGMMDVSDERFRYLRQLPNLKDISFYCATGADDFLNNIQGMPSVELLTLSMTGISDKGIRAVASFPNLKRLQIDERMRDITLEPLRGHPSLE